MVSCILKPPLFILLFLPLTSSNDAYRNYKDGDVIFGGLFPIHYSNTGDHCTELSTTGLGYAEATMFTIEKINKNSSNHRLRFKRLLWEKCSGHEDGL